MQQSDLDLTMLFNVIRERARTSQRETAANQVPGTTQRVRTLIRGPRRPIGRRSGQVGAPSSG